jgi:ankyrin repeat protein
MSLSSVYDTILQAIWDGDRADVEGILNANPEFNVDAFPKDSSPLLAEAVAYGRVDIVAFLLDRGADVNLQYGKYAFFPLFKAVQADFLFCSRENPPDFPVLVKLLLERGANVNAVHSDGRNVLFGAVTFESDMDRLKALVRVLVNAGADVNCVDASGVSLLDWAISPMYYLREPFYGSGELIGSEELITFLRGLGAKRSSELLTA